MLFQDWAPMNRLHRLPLALVSRIPPSALPQLPSCPCNCCQYWPAQIQIRQEASATDMDSNVFGSFFFLHTNSSHSTPHLCVSVFLCGIVSTPHSVLPGIFVPALSQTVSLRQSDNDRWQNLRLYKKPCRWVSTCVTALSDAHENHQRSGQVLLQSLVKQWEAVWWDFVSWWRLLRVNVMPPCSGGLPQQPVDPLLLYLSPWSLEGHVCGWNFSVRHALLAWPLCRCPVEGWSLSQRIIC